MSAAPAYDPPVITSPRIAHESTAPHTGSVVYTSAASVEETERSASTSIQSVPAVEMSPVQRMSRQGSAWRNAVVSAREGLPADASPPEAAASQAAAMAKKTARVESWMEVMSVLLPSPRREEESASVRYRRS